MHKMKKITTFLFILALFFNYFIYLTFANKFLVNEFNDKTTPVVELPLSSESFSSKRNRRKVFDVNFRSGELENGQHGRNALYNRGFFEGDIVTNGLSSNTIKEFLGEIRAPNGIARNALRNPVAKWPKNRDHVVIPVVYSSQYTQKFINKIDRAMQEFHQRTCIRFIPKTSLHMDYVYIMSDRFCYSEVGRKGGKQILSLTEECMRGSEGVGAIIHEMMHTIGFYHEQSRADRNNYVTIHLENVLDDAKANFDTYNLEKITHLGTSYDYESILHYDMYAFSKNGRPTIVPKKPGVVIGQRRGFSSIDIQKINKLYECGMHKEINPIHQSSQPIYQNMPSIIKIKGTNSSKREAWLEMPESHSQNCMTDQSRRVYYEAVSEPVPFKVLEASMKYERKIAFTLEAYNSSEVFYARDDHYACSNFCLCAFNTNGNEDICYVPMQANNFYINFISNCQANACYIYAAIYDLPHGNKRPGLMQEGTKVPFVPPNPFTDPVGPNSGYLKVRSVSCTGCEAAKKTC